MDCTLPGSSVYGMLQARIMEWVAMSSSRGSFRPSYWTHILHLLHFRKILYHQGRHDRFICSYTKFSFHMNNWLSDISKEERRSYHWLIHLFIYLFIQQGLIEHICSAGASQMVLVGKNPPARAGSRKRRGFSPCIGKIPWRRTWQPTPLFLPRASHGQRSLAGCSP